MTSSDKEHRVRAVTDLAITLVTGSPEEVRVREALDRVRGQFDLTVFERTHEVRIERGVIPHSHPVLTLSDRYGHEDDRLLATYLHEQLHWWSMDCPGARDGRDEQVYASLERDFPLPLEPPAGCGDLLSNLIHLHVCWLELRAVSKLLGEDRARSILGSMPYYTAVYETVLREHDELEKRFAAAGMDLPTSSE